MRIAIASALILATVLGTVVVGYRLHRSGTEAVAAPPARLVIWEVPGGTVGKISCSGSASRARTAMLRELAQVDVDHDRPPPDPRPALGLRHRPALNIGGGRACPRDLRSRARLLPREGGSAGRGD